MDKQTTLAFILIGIILMIWLYTSTPTVPPDQSQRNKAEDSLIIEKQKLDEKEKEELKLNESKESEKSDSITLGKFFRTEFQNEEFITIENDLAIIEVSTKGGKITKYFLKEYKNWYHNLVKNNSPDYQKMVQLINYSLGGSFDIEFVSTEGKVISTSDLIFEINRQEKRFILSGDDSLNLTFKFKVDELSSIVKNYTFYGSRYDSRFDLELNKMNNIISNNIYDLVWKGGLHFVEENSVDEANYSNSSFFYGGEQIIVDAPHSNEKIEEEKNGRVDWFTVRNKYFAGVIAPVKPENVEGIYVQGYSKGFPMGGIREYYDVRLKMPFKNHDQVKESFNVYVGPVSYDILKSYGNNLDKIVDFGSFFGLRFIVRPIAEYVFLPLFKFLNSFITNFGVVIVIFSLIIKVALYPLTKSSMMSMKKMQMLQPKITEIKEKLKDDPQKMNKETMKLYSTYGINPAGGCLPLLLQMPIFIALWGLFQSVIELRQQSFIWWITDLSRPDVIFDLGFKMPIFGISQISGLALLMGITTFAQQKMTVKDPQQKMLVYIMPVMLTILFMSFPSGLNLYYFLFNLFSIAQQYYINNYGKTIELVPVKNPKKSKGFMERMMEAADEKSKQQQKKKK